MDSRNRLTTAVSLDGFAERVIISGAYMVLLFCRYESIHDNASLPSVRRATFIVNDVAESAHPRQG